MRALLGAARRALRAPRGLPRLRLTRRAGGFLGALAMLLGIALVGDALITVLWRDPITAVFAQHEQKELGKKLKSAEEAPLSAARAREGRPLSRRPVLRAGGGPAQALGIR
jgi:hypothetical protein